MRNNHRELAYLVLRAGLGLNLFLHGFVRVGGAFAGFQEWMYAQFAASPLPKGLVTLATYGIPPTEIIVGVLLLGGLLTGYALLLGSLELYGLLFGMCLLQKWDIVGLQTGYVFLFAVLLYFLDLNTLSIDGLVRRRQAIPTPSDKRPSQPRGQ